MNSKTPPSNSTDKVVFTVDQDCYFQPTIELASAIAIANRTSIHGLYVEDLDLLHMASFPFVNEVSLTTAQTQVLDYTQLLCSFEASSRHFRQSLVRHAEQSALAWSYSTARGKKLKMALEASVKAKFLIIGQSNKTRTQSQLQGNRPTRILLINNHNQNHNLNLLGLLELVMQKLTMQSVELIVVSSAEDFTSDIRQYLIKALSTHPHSRITQIAHDTLLDHLTLSKYTLDYVIATRYEPDLVYQIMQKVNCPVILAS